MPWIYSSIVWLMQLQLQAPLPLALNLMDTQSFGVYYCQHFNSPFFSSQFLPKNATVDLLQP